MERHDPDKHVLRQLILTGSLMAEKLRQLHEFVDQRSVETKVGYDLTNSWEQCLDELRAWLREKEKELK